MSFMKSRRSVLNSITDRLNNWSIHRRHYVELKDIDIDHPALQKINVYNNKKYKYHDAVAMESLLSKLLKGMQHAVNTSNVSEFVNYQKDLIILRDDMHEYLENIIDIANAWIYRHDQLDSYSKQKGGTVDRQIIQNIQDTMMILNQKRKTNIISLQSWILKYDQLYKLVSHLCNLSISLQKQTSPRSR